MIYVGIIGGSSCRSETRRRALETGKLIAGEGWTLVCGGMGGVMEAACEGARKAGGVTIGILPGESGTAGNRYLSYRIVTGMGHLRNGVVVRSSDVIVAFEGSYGTLNEIAFANITGVPVIGFGSWKIEPAGDGDSRPYIREVGTPAEAVSAVREILGM
ncbi:MAG: TIGR00725 family protein [Spirochaetales bacterium]|nr:TIGR00725 family protein [Spirochaetales bacterium]